MFFPYFFDPTFVILLPAILLSMWAQWKVHSAFSQYSRISARNGASATQICRMLLDRAGLFNVPIEHIRGELTDHYDPRAKVLRLSSSVNGYPSIAAIGVAAHETGHAIQDKEGYTFLRVRNAIAPVVQICSFASMPLLLIGLLFGAVGLAQLGIVLFCGVLVFQLVTLPVEFDASARALKMLKETNTLSDGELLGAKKVLDAAALTYVAAALMAALQVLRLLAIVGMSSRRR
ncbi:MAG: zinc metallopeptidase [Synergistaceae bacterium]|nr:zinc metallopeptidase [Synergistaceae bacterium]